MIPLINPIKNKDEIGPLVHLDLSVCSFPGILLAFGERYCMVKCMLKMVSNLSCS
jgi:hypothetical protein